MISHLTRVGPFREPLGGSGAFDNDFLLPVTPFRSTRSLVDACLGRHYVVTRVFVMPLPAKS